MEQQQVSPSQGKIVHDIFEDPAIARARKEDPFFRMLSKWWKQILIVVAAVAAAFFARHRFHETYVARMSESAEFFSQISQRLAALGPAYQAVRDLEASLNVEGGRTPEKEKELEESRKKLAELTTQFTESLRSLEDAQAPYSELAGLYRTFYVQRYGTKEERELELGRVTSASASADLHPLLKEGEELARARMLLDTEGKREEGRVVLRRLAESSQFMRIQAVLALMRTAEGESEESEATGLLEKIKNEFPEQSELISQELARTGA